MPPLRPVVLGAVLVGSLLAARATALADSPVTGAAPAAEAKALLADVESPAGFSTTTFATPSEAAAPVFVAATPDGTLYVSSDGNGSPESDRDCGCVLRLRDTDGDGRADEVKTFVADLDSPRGLVMVDERLIVFHPPAVTAFRDADGDGVAEERERLVSGIGFDPSDRPVGHTTNGLTLAIDGWIYAAIGDTGFLEAEGSDGRRLQLRGGGVVRFRPDGSGLERFARGTRNIVEVAVSPLLDMVARDTTDDGGSWNATLHAFTGLEDHGYPRRFVHFPEEIVTPLAADGGGSGTGACWIDEPWMPAAWNNAAFSCNRAAGRVFWNPLAVVGAGYEAGQEEFLKLPWATDLDVDAVGHIYAASWPGGQINRDGPDAGFIARITPDGPAPAALPDWKTASAAELVAVLAGPSHRRRLEAQRTLLRRKLVADAAAALEALASDAAAEPANRVAALFTLALGQGREAGPLLGQLAADPAISAWVVRALGDLAAAGIDVPREPLRAAVRSRDARTRREAVVAIVRLGDGGEARWLLPALADADPLVVHTAVEGLVRLANTAEQDVIDLCGEAVDAAAVPPEVNRQAARVLGEIHSDAGAEAVAARLDRTRDPLRRAALVHAGARLWRRESEWKGGSSRSRPDTTGPYCAAETWEASPLLEELVGVAVAAAASEELPTLARSIGLHRMPAEVIVPELVARGRNDADAMQALTIYFDLTGAEPPAEIRELLPAVAPPAGELP